MVKKGIILAGGQATRLRPCTKVTCKQLLPVYNRPLIYYPLNTLVKAGIKEVLIITSPEFVEEFINLLGNGNEFGISISYEIQNKPEGIAQAFIIGKRFIGNDNVCLVLGDNIFEDSLSEEISSFESGAKIFAKRVPDPERFGVVEFDKNGRAISIEEKPQFPKSNYCVTGLYVYDNNIVKISTSIKKSARGEYEITDVNRWYLDKGSLSVSKIEGAWIDAGTFDSLLEAQILAKEKLQFKMEI